MSKGMQALQERLTSLRASYERQSCEVQRLERAQAVGLQASRAAAQRMHQDILTAEAEVRSCFLFEVTKPDGTLSRRSSQYIGSISTHREYHSPANGSQRHTDIGCKDWVQHLLK